VRLLRFLDRGEIRAVGGTSVKHVDARVIAATNHSLPLQVREQRFREDLFFRLSVVPLHLPPLRERKADLPALAQHHVRQAASRLGVAVPRIGADALDAMAHYDWPGNIRELQNVLECALVLGAGETISSGDLLGLIRRPMPTTTSFDPPMLAPHMPSDVQGTVARCNGNLRHAAAALGISRTTLWRRLKRSRGTQEFLPARSTPH